MSLATRCENKYSIYNTRTVTLLEYFKDILNKVSKDFRQFVKELAKLNVEKHGEAKFTFLKVLAVRIILDRTETWVATKRKI